VIDAPVSELAAIVEVPATRTTRNSSACHMFVLDASREALAMSLFPLDGFLKRTIVDGSLTLIGPDGRAERFGHGAPAVTVSIKEKSLAPRLLLFPDMTLGEAYMNGSFVVESGDIYDFFNLCFANFGLRYAHWFWSAQAALRRLQQRLKRSNSLSTAPAEIAHHYDLPDELYGLFLDADRQYSCAYYRTASDTLEQAQKRKKDRIASKLLLRSGQRVLDIGCGWGGLALHLARTAEVEVTGLTLSKSQCAYAQDRAMREGLHNRVRFYVMDYRNATDHYDRIVSVGMFEHVGIGRCRTYFDKLRELLSDDGVALVDTIGTAAGPGGSSPWIEKYIFPGGHIPALSEIAPSIEQAGLYTTDLEVLRIHYAETLKAWRERFKANRAQAVALYGERFCRMWEFYLASCEAGFRHSGLVNFQFQLSKRIDAVPITRDYL
jgi:cyclopropane-fatty-acyl-phospholipid synthase